MVKGVDTANNVSSIVNALYGNGYRFVARYYSLQGNSKRISTSESATIGQACLKRVMVYQNLHNSYSKFSASIALGDAGDAVSQARAVGQTLSSTIYFAVDYDASLEEVNNNIKSHFVELKSVINTAGYQLGVYGSSLVCKTLKEAGIVKKTWLTMASDWGYGTVFNDWDIHQVDTVTVSGVLCDKNEAKDLSSIGAW